MSYNFSNHSSSSLKGFFELSETDMVAFFEWPGVEPLPLKDHGVPTRGPIAFDHVSFGVDSEDGLWELKDKVPCPAALEGAEPQPGKWPAVTQKTPPEDRLVFPGEGSVLAENKEDRINGCIGVLKGRH